MNNDIYIGDGMAFIKINDSIGAAVFTADSKDFLANPDANPKDVPIKGYKKYVPWGESNDVPQQVVLKVEKSPDMSTNMLFNIAAGYGDGVVPVKRELDKKGKIVLTPVIDNKDINEFFANNNIKYYLNEQLTDLNFFGNTFPELILNRDKAGTRKVVELNSKEACFSRWEEMNPKTGAIEHHFYSAAFFNGKEPKEEEIEATPVLNRKNPVMDLLVRLGRIPSPKTGKTTTDDKNFRFIVPVNFPSPGRFYYQKPYWYSLFVSGWYDFALLIPEYKKAILKNGMTIKYMVKINEKYFPALFAEEGIKGKEQEKARIATEYENIKNFLSGTDNAGKATFGKVKFHPDGKEEPMVQIIPLENNFKGGEYIDDSEEVSNIIAYGMGVHASLIGSHGKSKTITGTEARELFIIKQSMLKPFRDLLLLPFYIIKAVNKWPDDIFFAIPNMELTTLDKNPSGGDVVIK